MFLLSASGLLLVEMLHLGRAPRSAFGQSAYLNKYINSGKRGIILYSYDMELNKLVCQIIFYKSKLNICDERDDY